MARRILVVEDDRDIAGLIEMHLRDLECEVTLAHDGLTALDLAIRREFDLIILDLMLPKLDGLEITKRLRARTNYTPILMLTARSSDVDRIVGLELGADDYLTKPFNVRELIARVKALLRRVDALTRPPDTATTATRLDFGELVIDTEKRKAEYAALQKKVTDDGPFVIMFQNANQVASRADVKGFKTGLFEDFNFYRTITK